MNLLLIALVLANQGSSVSQKVSVELPVTRLGAALATLSTTTGVQLTADPSLAKNWVTLQVHNCSLQDLMTHMAGAIHADWSPKGQGFNLSRGPEREKEIRQATYDARYAEAKKAVAYLQSQVASSFDSTKARAISQRLEQIQNNKDGERSYVAEQALTSELPQYRACSRLAALLPVSDLANIPEGGRVVFSTAPTKMQQALTGNTKAVFAEMIEEQARLDELLADQGLKINSPAWANRMLSGSQVPGKALVIVTRRSEQGLSVVARLVSAQGDFTSQDVVNTKPESERNPFMTSEIVGDKSALLVPHPVLQNLSKVIGANNTDRSFLTSEARDVLLKPDQTDPAEIMLGLMVRDHARTENLNLVAVVSEKACLAGLVMAMAPKATWARLVMVLNLIGDDATRTKEWITIAPRDPMDNERNQVDRPILAEMASVGLSGQQATLDQRIRFAQSFQGDYYWSLLGVWGIMAGYNGDFEDFDALRFFGSLSPTQLLTLKQEGGFYQYANLSEAQKRHLQYMTFVQRPYVNSQREVSDRQNMIGYGGLANEPTEALPAGIPGSTRFTMTDVTKEAVFGLNKDGSLQKRPITAMDLAWQQYSKSRPDLYPWATDQPQYESFRVGSHRTISMAFQFNADCSTTRSIEQAQLPTDGKPLTRAQLGKKFNDDFDRYLKQYKDAEPPPP